MKKVTRTIETHTIYVSEVKFMEGEIKTFPLEPIKISNTSIDKEKALKLSQKTYGKLKQYIITDIQTDSKTYGLDFDKFIEQAEIIEK